MLQLELIHLSKLFILYSVNYDIVNVLDCSYYNCHIKYCYNKFQYLEKCAKFYNLCNSIVVNQSIFRKIWIIFNNINQSVLIYLFNLTHYIGNIQNLKTFKHSDQLNEIEKSSIPVFYCDEKVKRNDS